MMKKYLDLKRKEQKLLIGNWVYLCLQPDQWISISHHCDLTLFPRYYGSFQVLQMVRSMAYKLDLPLTARIHPTFHISQIKKKIRAWFIVVPKFLPMDSMGVLKPKPEEVLGHCLTRVRNQNSELVI